MIKKLMGAMLLLPSLVAAQSAYTLKGKIAEVGESARMYLCYQDASNEYRFDSAVVNNGMFEFHGTIDQPRRAAMMLAYKPVKFKFFMEVLVKVKNEQDFKNASIDVLSLYLEPGTTTVISKDSLFKAAVSGSDRNRDLSLLNLEKSPVYSGMKALVSTINDKGMKGTLEVNEWAQLEEQYKKEQGRIKQLDLAFVKKHPASEIDLDILEQYVDTESAKATIEPLYKQLSVALKKSERGKTLGERVSANLKVDLGAIAPEFSLPDTSGKQVSLASYRGKYVLVDFWASWCSPCRAENPTVIRAYNAFKNKNFTVLGVSLDKTVSQQKWRDAIVTDQIGQWAQVADLTGDKNAAAVLFHVSNIPQNFLLDPNGKIIARNLHGEELQAKLSATLH